MSLPRVLVVGATGQVGSQVVKILAARGHPTRALVRRAGAMIDGAPPDVEYVVGDLRDPDSLARALESVEVVVSTANAIIPAGRAASTQRSIGEGYEALIALSEQAGVRQFVQASVPFHPLRSTVPELSTKRAIEVRLEASPMATTIVRNPAFTDVWLVMAGAREMIGADPHATTRRPFGFMRLWQRLTGGLVTERGILLAPGGPAHGSPFITTHDVAQMMAGVVGHPEAANVVIEAGGPEWVTWAEVARLLSEKAGRRVRAVPMPSVVAAAGQRMLSPFSPAAAGVLGLVRFVAAWQPQWDSAPVVERFRLPRQTTVAEYIDRNWNDA